MISQNYYWVASAIGYLCGAVHFAWIGWAIHRRMVARLFANFEEEFITKELEKRRDAIDYDVDQETPAGAGPAGEISSLFEMHPGAMTLSHIGKRKSDEKG